MADPRGCGGPLLRWAVAIVTRRIVRHCCQVMNGVDIIVTSDDAHLSPFMTADATLATPSDGGAVTLPGGRRSHKSSISGESDSRIYGGSSSVMSYASSYDTDNVAIRHPVYSG